ncbi:MAG: aldolase, partial [Methanoregula sp.]|nr:aldolase [Methanoregula sp.]
MPPAPEIRIPLDVPPEEQERYRENYDAITHGTGRLMLFAGDQKIEHLNDDFFGEG